MTGMVQTFADANFAGSPAPLYVKRNNGFPAPHLAGLYLLQDGTLNAAMPSTLANAVAGGGVATRVVGNPAPIRRVYGMEMNPAFNDLRYATPHVISPSWTVVIAARQSTASSATSQLPAFLTINAGGTLVQVNAFLQSGNAGDGQWGLFLNPGTITRDGLSGSQAKLPGVFAARFDGTTGKVDLRDHAGRATSVVRAGAIGMFDSVTDAWQIGWRTGTPITAEYYVCAIYNTAIPDGLMLDAVNAAAAVCTSRGLALST